MQTDRLPLIRERDNLEHFYLIALLFLCGAVYFYGLGRLPFIGPDEPRYAEVAREMYATGDWITPRLGGIKWFEKPALTYWLLAVGYALFGENEFGARFGVAVASTFAALLLYFFGRRARSARFGYLSAAALVTCGLWPGFARGVTCDLPLTVAIEFALLSFFLWESKESGAGDDRLWYVFCFALGLATLAKGLAGVALPMMIIAPYLILTGAWKSLLRPRLIIFGALIFLATAAVWYAPVIARNGREFIDEFFIGHHFQRYLSNKYRHPQPFYFFPLVAVAGCFPWSFYLISSVTRTKVRARRGQTELGQTEVCPTTKVIPNDRLHLFLLLWIVAPIAFFSFSGSKLPGYILPIFPAVALIIGGELERWWRDESRPPALPQFLTAAFTAAAGIGAGFLLQRELGVSARDAWLMGSIAVLVAVVYLGLLLFKNGRVATLYLPIGLAVILVAATHLVFPGLGNRESLKRLSLTALESARPYERLVFFINNDQSINFYAANLPLRDERSELVTAKSGEEIGMLIEAGRSQSILVITPKRWRDGVTKSGLLRAEKIGEQNFNASCSPECDWVLLRAQPARYQE
ncbi:MAG TPA: glycosyltransferase family 39 protein [Blastocatellia bacterium]|nr:glycosyltransferase family 39 protein [Blastocatellia bacterium]